MILKIKESEASWHFIDRIESATVYRVGMVADSGDDKMYESTYVNYERDREIINQDITRGCYLLNDDGKTIEKLS